ncbi:MAG: agmatinase [Phycisphaerae bacterium]|nr:agmatinase [Phycisphaerae bacterium]
MINSNAFLDLPTEFTAYDRSRYAILPVPYEGTVSYVSGTAGGPMAILEASGFVELLDDELHRECHTAGIHTLPAVHPAPGPDEQMRRVYEAAAPVVRDGKFLLTLGGEHSITSPLVRAMCERHGEVSVLQIDAHADLRDELGGTGCSHGAVMRRVLDITPHLCQVGIRSFSHEELLACPGQVEAFITPRMIRSGGDWIARVLERLRGKVYVTIDIDGFDPAYAPGTGTPEPGGLDWFEVTALLRSVCGEREVVGADIVEVRPIPGHHVTEFLAAKLAYKIIAYTQGRRA